MGFDNSLKNVLRIPLLVRVTLHIGTCLLNSLTYIYVVEQMV